MAVMMAAGTVVIIAVAGVYVLTYVSRKKAVIKGLRSRIDAYDELEAQRAARALFAQEQSARAPPQVQWQPPNEVTRSPTPHFYPAPVLTGDVQPFIPQGTEGAC